MRTTRPGRLYDYQLFRQRNTLLNQPFELYWPGKIYPTSSKRLTGLSTNQKDSTVIQRELQNLKLSCGASNIVQLFGIVISSDSYQTTTEHDESLVVRGLLMEHHRGWNTRTMTGASEYSQGFMETMAANWLWLLHLHQKSITYMNLKPSNVVIDINDNALLID